MKKSILVHVLPKVAEKWPDGYGSESGARQYRKMILNYNKGRMHPDNLIIYQNPQTKIYYVYGVKR